MTGERRLRLLKVNVQPVFVIDDGVSLREVQGSTVSVVGAEWLVWAAGAFTDEQLALLLDTLAPGAREEQ